MNPKLALHAVPLQRCPPEHDLHSGPKQLSVRLLTKEQEFAELALEWNRLHALAEAASVFNSWLWQYNWWKLYGAGRPLRILVAQENGETVGILALYVQRIKLLGTSVRVLRFVGTEGDTHPDDLGPVLSPGSGPAAALALADAALRLRAVDVLLFSDIDPRSCFTHAIEQAASNEGLHGCKGASERIAYIELPASWQAFLGALDSKRRWGIRRARTKLAAAYPDVRFFVWEDPSSIDYAVDQLILLHRKRWQAAGNVSESFSTLAYVEFHRGIIRSFLARGCLRLYCLEVGGKLAAMTYSYRFRNRIFVMQAGFDPDLARYKPGGVLLGHAIEHAIGEGNTVFDFLRGEHHYKDELASGKRNTLFVRLYRNTPAALIYRVRVLRLPLAKQRIRRALDLARRRAAYYARAARHRMARWPS